MQVLRQRRGRRLSGRRLINDVCRKEKTPRWSFLFIGSMISGDGGGGGGEGWSLRGLKLVGIQFIVQKPPRHWPFNHEKMAKTNLYP